MSNAPLIGGQVRAGRGRIRSVSDPPGLGGCQVAWLVRANQHAAPFRASALSALLDAMTVWQAIY